MCTTIFMQTNYFMDIKPDPITPLCISYLKLTCTCMYHTCSIVQNIGEGKFSCMVFCYLSKAFDRVCHCGLIFELQMVYSVYEDLVLQLFLSQRSKKVMCKDFLS